jgi:hypothetical protein
MGGRHRAGGQSLVEFALALPVLLIVLLFAIDFGRAFYSWVILQNASRLGANYAALNPEGWEGAGNPTLQAEYEALVTKDWGVLDCDTPPDPVFTDSAGDTSSAGQTPDTPYDVGDMVEVTLTCPFHPLTPIISAVVGSSVQLTASSAFRIRSGEIAGLVNAPAIPKPSTVGPTPTPAPTAVPTAGPTPAPTPVPPCTITIVRNPTSNNINSGQSVAFSATASGCTITSYAWTFPLGTPPTSTAPAPAVTFSTPNNTNVTVTLVALTTSGSRTDTEQFNLKK